MEGAREVWRPSRRQIRVHAVFLTAPGRPARAQLAVSSNDNKARLVDGVNTVVQKAPPENRDARRDRRPRRAKQHAQSSRVHSRRHACVRHPER
jgi:hypothetical protein